MNDGFTSKFRGNAMIYLNKYDTARQSWLPAAECPFAWLDPNHDGQGEVVLRVSIGPLESYHGNDIDYANNYTYIWAPEALPLAKLGNLNMRLSFNIDPEPRPMPPVESYWHYNFGFTMVAPQPYRSAHMFYTNPRRRPPQTVVRIPRNEALGVALSYPAEKTGFSWNEDHEVDRWEGQFWTYERELLHNTGGLAWRWNMRREYSEKPASRRELYYSDVDKRYHLYGASEGGLEVVFVVEDKKDLEFRFFDSNHDGHFDTWEVFEEGNPVPVRVTKLLDPRTRRIALDRKLLMEDYSQRVLPQAIKEDEQLIAAMKKFMSSPLAAKYGAAAQNSRTAEKRRLCLDIGRELYFLKTRVALYTRNASGDSPRLLERGLITLKPGPIDGRYTLQDTLVYWKLAKQIETFVTAYGKGRLDEARKVLEEISVAGNQ